MISLAQHRRLQDLLNYGTAKKNQVIKRTDSILNISEDHILVVSCIDTSIDEKDRTEPAVYDGTHVIGEGYKAVHLRKIIEENRNTCDPYITFRRDALMRFLEACDSETVVISTMNKFLYIYGNCGGHALEGVLAPRIEEKEGEQ